MAAPWIALALLFTVLPMIFASGSALTMLSLMGIMIVFALSYNMLLGETGLLSFGHAVYYGLGGFLTVHAMNTVIHDQLPVPLPLMPLVGGFGGLLFGIIFGSVSTRRAGTAFAMISLGLGELVASSSLILRGFFGGEEGITTNRTKLLRVFGLNFGPQIEVYYLIAAWCLVVPCWRCMRSRARRSAACATRCARMPSARSSSATIRTHGALHRLLARRLLRRRRRRARGDQFRADQFALRSAPQQSGVVLLAAYIGGVGNFIGPVIGAVLVTWLQVMLSDLTDVWQLYFGLLFIGVVMFAPNGIAGLVMLHEPSVAGARLWFTAAARSRLSDRARAGARCWSPASSSSSR